MDHELELRIDRALASVSQSQVAVPTVIFRMWCSVTGKPFHIAAEQKGTTLVLVRNITPGAGGTTAGANANVQDAASVGQFRLENGGWPGCPHCGALTNVRKNLDLPWGCGCRPSPQIHCVGERNGVMRCGACGQQGDFSFVKVPSLDVHGAVTAAGSSKALAPSARPRLSPPAPRLPLSRK